MIGHVYIKGQIGNSVDSDGNITERGVELQDVIIQVEANKGCEIIYFHITSGGGDVHKGQAIADYISKIPGAITIADGLCGSIATEIHLSVPVSNRKIVSGTEYFIHNPLLQGVSGNASELAMASEHVMKYQKEMLSMYMKSTGLDKPALEGLMNQETSLTDEQCIALGFCSNIIPQTELKAVAFINKNTNKNNLKMDIAKALSEGFATVVAELKKPNTPEVKAAMVATDGGELMYQSEGALPTVGEVVMIGEEVAPAGNYTVEDGTVITVDEAGLVSEIVEVEVEATVEELQAKIEELQAENNGLVASIEENKETLKAELKTEMDSEIAEAVQAEITKFKETIASGYTPKAEKKVFNKNATKPELSMREKAEAKKAEYKAKK